MHKYGPCSVCSPPPCGEGLGVGVGVGVVVLDNLGGNAPKIAVGLISRKSLTHFNAAALVACRNLLRTNTDPHPQPLPTRGRGADRVRRLGFSNSEARARTDLATRRGPL